MLRPDRRTRRVFAGILVTITALALIWPASIALGRTAASATVSGPASAGAPHSNRQPTVHGLWPPAVQGERRREAVEAAAAPRARTARTAARPTRRAASARRRSPRSPRRPRSRPRSSSAHPPRRRSARSRASTRRRRHSSRRTRGSRSVRTTSSRARTRCSGSRTARARRPRADVQLFDFFAFDDSSPASPTSSTASATRTGCTTPSTTAGSARRSPGTATPTAPAPTDDSLGLRLGRDQPDRRPDRRLLPVLHPRQLVPAGLPGGRHVGRQVRGSRPTSTSSATQRPTAPRTSDFDGGSVTAFDWTADAARRRPCRTSPTSSTPAGSPPAGGLSRRASRTRCSSSARSSCPRRPATRTSDVAYMTVTGTNAAGGTTLSADAGPDRRRRGARFRRSAGPETTRRPHSHVGHHRPTSDRRDLAGQRPDGRVDDRLRPGRRRLRDPGLCPGHPAQHLDRDADPRPGHADRRRTARTRGTRVSGISQSGILHVVYTQSGADGGHVLVSTATSSRGRGPHAQRAREARRRRRARTTRALAGATSSASPRTRATRTRSGRATSTRPRPAAGARRSASSRPRARRSYRSPRSGCSTRG